MDFASWILMVTTWLAFGETGICLFPRLEEDYDSEGMVCSWEEKDFVFDEKNNEYILKPYDEDDNCFEEIARERYWEKR